MRKFSDYLFKHGRRPDEIMYRDRRINVVLGDAMMTMVPLGMAGPLKKYIQERNHEFMSTFLPFLTITFLINSVGNVKAMPTKFLK